MQRPSLFVVSLEGSGSAQLVKRTQFQYHLFVTRQTLFRGPQVEKPWSKRLKLCGAAYRRPQPNRKQNMTPGSYMHVERKQKNRNSNDEKDGNNQKKQD